MVSQYNCKPHNKLCQLTRIVIPTNLSPRPGCGPSDAMQNEKECVILPFFIVNYFSTLHKKWLLTWCLREKKKTKTRLNTLKVKNFAIYRKIKNLNGRGLLKYSLFFKKCMSQGMTNITLSLTEPNFTCSQNAVDQR